MALGLHLSLLLKLPVEFRYPVSLKSYPSFVIIIIGVKKTITKNESWQMKGKRVVQMKPTPCTNWIRISQHWRQCILCCPPSRKGQHTWLSNISHYLPTWQEGTRTITTAEMKCDPADQCETSICPMRVQWSTKKINDLPYSKVEWGGGEGKTKLFELSSIFQA